MSKNVALSAILVGVILIFVGIAFISSVNAQEPSVELLSEPVSVTSLPGGDEVHLSVLDEMVLVNAHSVTVSFDLHSECLLTAAQDEGDDASAFFFQTEYGWRYVNLAYLVDLGFSNCENGVQTLEIPISRFMDKDLTMSLDPLLGVSGFGFRIWDFKPDTVVTFSRITVNRLPSC